MSDKLHGIILIISIVIIVTITGCIDLTNEEKATHSGWFEGIGDNYVLIPAVHFQNTTFADIDDYKVEKGKGTISQERVDGKLMINISSDSNTVEFKYQKNNNSTYIDDYSFSNSYINRSNNINYISIYYSGNDECYSFLKFEIHDDFGAMSWDVGPAYLTNGWNEVGVNMYGWMA